LQIARGSASELEYQLLLASDLGYLDMQTYEGLALELDHVQRMLGAFLKRLRSKEA
jgi:four helix bundle protein